MKIDYSNRFLKNFRKRIAPNASLDKKFSERLALFTTNKKSPELHDHKLAGKWEGFRAFSITGNTRVIYRQARDDGIELYDIGTHNQVY